MSSFPLLDSGSNTTTSRRRCVLLVVVVVVVEFSVVACMRLVVMCDGGSPHEAFSTGGVFASIGSLARVAAEMDLEIVSANKRLVTSGEGASKAIGDLSSTVLAGGGELGGSGGGGLVRWEMRGRRRRGGGRRGGGRRGGGRSG